MSYLTFKNSGKGVASTISLKWANSAQVWYRIPGDPEGWTEYTKGATIGIDTLGIELKGNGVETSIVYHFSMTGNIAASGDVTSLTNEVGGDCTLTANCYLSMFQGCSALTAPPELPSLILTENCYNSMFAGCTSLKTAPALPATTLADTCYGYMFNNCVSLTATPELPAMTAAQSCYVNMFQNCTSIRSMSELPATTLKPYCYRHMFQGCTSLIIPPILPATTMTQYCYEYMFAGCTSLVTVPKLPATTLANYCYHGMFNNCTSLIGYITAEPEYTLIHNYPTTSANGWNLDMYRSINSVSTVPTSPSSNTNYYFKPATLPPLPTIDGKKIDTFGTDNRGTIVVVESGNFLTFRATNPSVESTVAPNWETMEKLYYRKKGETQWIRITEKNTIIPVDTIGVEFKGKNVRSGHARWTLTGSLGASGSVTSLIDEVGYDPKVIMQPYQFASMFCEQTALVNITHDMLPAEHCPAYCYAFMFCGTGIRSIPMFLLNSQSLEDHCYTRMFLNCRQLTSLPDMLLPCANPGMYAYRQMFMGCTELVNIPNIISVPVTGAAREGTFQEMFMACTKLQSIPDFKWRVCFNPNGYIDMYSGCSNLKVFTSPQTGYSRPIWIPAAQGQTPYLNMFAGIHPDSDVPATPSGNCTYYVKDQY